MKAVYISAMNFFTSLGIGSFLKRSFFLGASKIMGYRNRK
jgi:hypothetical protein